MDGQAPASVLVIPAPNEAGTNVSERRSPARNCRIVFPLILSSCRSSGAARQHTRVFSANDAVASVPGAARQRVQQFSFIPHLPVIELRRAAWPCPELSPSKLNVATLGQLQIGDDPVTDWYFAQFLLLLVKSLLINVGECGLHSRNPVVDKSSLSKKSPRDASPSN